MAHQHPPPSTVAGFRIKYIAHKLTNHDTEVFGNVVMRKKEKQTRKVQFMSKKSLTTPCRVVESGYAHLGTEGSEER